MTCNCEAKLKEYSKLLGLSESRSLTLDDLIKSHKDLRAITSKEQSEIEKIRSSAREQAYADTRKFVLTEKYISTDRLKKMSIQELVDILASGDGN